MQVHPLRTEKQTCIDLTPCSLESRGWNEHGPNWVDSAVARLKHKYILSSSAGQQLLCFRIVLQEKMQVSRLWKHFKVKRRCQDCPSREDAGHIAVCHAGKYFSPVVSLPFHMSPCSCLLCSIFNSTSILHFFIANFSSSHSLIPIMLQVSSYSFSYLLMLQVLNYSSAFSTWYTSTDFSFSNVCRSSFALWCISVKLFIIKGIPYSLVVHTINNWFSDWW